jgi:hypothetical protein
VFASFLGFPANACHKMVKKIGFSNFWAPLLGTLSFLFLLICLLPHCLRHWQGWNLISRAISTTFRNV